ncbi:hypothetical protein TSUD_276210, partial [Trifolium subterraneum]
MGALASTSRDVAEKILETPLVSSAREDKVVWDEERNGCYSVKSGYKLAMRYLIGSDKYHVMGNWNGIWKAQAPHKARHLLWRLCRGCLPTRSRLLERRVECTLNCPNKGYQNGILNPYFMHPNENPGNILATPLLSGPNYHSWSRAVTVALRSKHKIHFINGSLPRPPDGDRDSIAWDRCNTMVMSWLSNSVEPEISQSILWMDTATEIWKELKERFYQGDVFRISDIQEEIYTLKQGDNSISSYYTKMKKLWQELDNFRPIPENSCHDACQAVVKMREYRDSDQVIRFLKGLNDNYSAVRSQIMLMEPLPNIGKVYSLLVQQERQFVLFSDEPKILAASGYNGNGRGSSSSRGRGDRGGKPSYGRGRCKGNKVCTFCGMTNHVVDECFKKHGFPPHMQNKGIVNNCHSNGAEEDSKSIAYEEDNGDMD